MATFVLVPGAFGSAWRCRKAERLLVDAGHRVFSTTPTGLGERAHLRTPEVGLGTHVQDLVELVTYEDLRDVELVGWSHADMAITGAADVVPERIGHLVYLDTGIPKDGECAHDLADPALPPRRFELARTQGDGWFVPSPTADRFAAYLERGELTAAELDDVVARFRPMPLKAFTDPVRRTNPAARALPRTYVPCGLGRPAGEPGVPSDMRRAREDGARIRPLPEASHLAPYTQPRAVADVLVEIAEQRAR